MHDLFIRRDRAENIYIYDRDNNYLVEIDSAANVKNAVKGSNPYFAVGFPYDFKVSPSGKMYLNVNGAITKLYHDGTTERLIKNDNVAQLYNFFYCFDEKDNLYADGGSSLYVLDSVGTLLKHVSNYAPIPTSTVIFADTIQSVFISYGDTNLWNVGNTYYSRSWAHLKKINITKSNLIQATTSTRVCNGDSIILSSITPGFHTYKWYNYGVQIAGATQSNLVLDTIVDAYFYCTLDNNNTCTSNLIHAEIEQNISIPNIQPSVNNCGYSFLTTATNYYAYHKWFRNDTLLPQRFFYATENGNYTLIDSNGCGSFPSPDTVIVFIREKPTSGLPIITRICNQQTITLQAICDSTLFIWYDGPAAINFTDTISIDSTAYFTLSMIDTSNGCTNKELIIVLEQIAPLANLLLDSAHCILKCDSVNGASYQWYFNSAPSIGDSSNFILADTTGSYYASIIINGCTYFTDTVLVNCSLTGLSDESFLNTITVFPNPSSGEFEINFRKLFDGKIELFNSLSEKIMSANINHQNKFNLKTNVRSGIYFLKITDAENRNIGWKKLVIE